MSSPWIVAFVVLCVLVLANSVVLLGLVRRITSFMELLENRLHALQFAEELQGLGPGDVVSPFEARDSSENLVESVALLQNGAVILLTDPGCEPCDQLAEELQRTSVSTGFPVYVVSEGADRYAGRFQAPIQTLYQQERKVATAFRSSITPQAFAMVSFAASQASASAMVSCCPSSGCGTDCAAGTRRFRCQCPGFTYCTSCQSRTSCYSGPC